MPHPGEVRGKLFLPRGLVLGSWLSSLGAPVHTHGREKCYPHGSISDTKCICSNPLLPSHLPANTAPKPRVCAAWIPCLPDLRPMLPSSARSPPATEPPHPLGYCPVVLFPDSNPESALVHSTLCPRSGCPGPSTTPRCTWLLAEFSQGEAQARGQRAEEG